MSTGAELSRRYWLECGLPAFLAYDPELMTRMAAGLIGEGSECFGYDDEISRDHDWGPGFCVWLSETDIALHGAEIGRIYANLPQVFDGYPVKAAPGRVGVFERSAFFRRFLGMIPERMTDWLMIPEAALAVSCNGWIFHDPEGHFTGMVEALRRIPQPVRQKKLAARCVTMMQSGQYNLSRCQLRGDHLAASMAVRDFTQAAAGAMLLLQKRWPPFYKWLPRALREVSTDGLRLAALLTQLNGITGQPLPDRSLQHSLITECCMLVAQEIRRQELTMLSGCDMQQIGLDIQSRITDAALKNLPVLAG